MLCSPAGRNPNTASGWAPLIRCVLAANSGLASGERTESMTRPPPGGEGLRGRGLGVVPGAMVGDQVATFLIPFLAAHSPSGADTWVSLALKSGFLVRVSPGPR